MSDIEIIDKDLFSFFNLPKTPSINNSFRIAKNKRRTLFYKSKLKKNYEQAMAIYFLENLTKEIRHSILTRLDEAIKKDEIISFEIQLALPKFKTKNSHGFFYKNNDLFRTDIDNIIKNLVDSITRNIPFDDKYLTKITAAKFHCERLEDSETRVNIHFFTGVTNETY